MNYRKKSIIAVLSSMAMAFLCIFHVSSVETEAAVRVMPLGDSITDGFSTVGGYREPLANKLEQNGLSGKIDFVGPNWGGNCYDPQHAGYSGYSIDNIPQENSISGARTGLSSFIDWLMETYPADVVMLQIGTNDILSYYDLENIGTRLEGLVDSVLKYIPEDGMLYLATIPCMDANNTLYINPYYFTPDSMDECVDKYNEEIKRIAADKQSQGKNIRLADINGVLTKEDLYDGVHPTADGYKKMSEYWYDTLNQYLNGEDTEPTLPTEPTDQTEPVTTAPPVTSVTTFTSVTVATEQTVTTTIETTAIPESTTAPQTVTQPNVTTSYAYKKGDVDCDGQINTADVEVLSRILVSDIKLTDHSGYTADMNNDGVINVFDMILLRRIILDN